MTSQLPDCSAASVSHQTTTNYLIIPLSPHHCSLPHCPTIPPRNSAYCFLIRRFQTHFTLSHCPLSHHTAAHCPIITLFHHPTAHCLIIPPSHHITAYCLTRLSTSDYLWKSVSKLVNLCEEVCHHWWICAEEFLHHWWVFVKECVTINDYVSRLLQPLVKMCEVVCHYWS